MTSPALPTAARIVVIGGGVGGASVAYHLAELGERDVLVARTRRADQRIDVPLGRPGRSAARRPDADPDEHVLRRAVPAAAGRASTRSAGPSAAASSSRRRPSGWRRSGARSAGRAPTTCRCTRSRPPRSPSGSRWSTSTASSARPTSSPTATSTRRSSATRLPRPRGANGVRIAAAHARASASTRSAAGCARCAPTAATSTARSSSTAAGCSRPRSAGWPACASRSCRCRTSTWSPSRSAARGDPPLPTLRDPDLLVYFRQEVDGLVMGGYERNPAPWTATARTLRRDPARLQRQAAGRGLAALRGDRHERAAARAGRWATSACAG